MSKSPIISNIPKEVTQVTKKLESAGFEAFLVGGCVRDHIMGIEPKDYDVTTNATPEDIIRTFGEDKTFYDNTFGTVGFKTGSENSNLKIIEITPYRSESQYSDYRHPDSVSFSKKIEDDLARRDFTINALAYSVSKRQIVDLYDGLKDISKKSIRTVGDPYLICNVTHLDDVRNNLTAHYRLNNSINLIEVFENEILLSELTNPSL